MTKIARHSSQLQTIFSYLENTVATASQVAEATGIYHKNICRYKRDLERAGHLIEVKKDTCPITGFKAWFITCDKTKFPPCKQLKLWN